LLLAVFGKRPCSDVELILDNLPPRMAECEFEMRDVYIRTFPLHIAAAKGAPRSIIERMLLVAPKAVRKKDYFGDLPLHRAARTENTDAIELLMDAYPEAVLEGEIGVGLHFIL